MEPVMILEALRVLGFIDQDIKPSQEVLLAVAQSPIWPNAVEEATIITTPESETERARIILADMVGDPTNKTVLDFGCGSGRCAGLARELGATKVVAYDKIIPNPNPYNITDDLNHVKTEAPYDYIILYDVIDHIMEQRLLDQAFETISACMTPSSELCVRCHPFTSRHGAHYYTWLNKAYIHFVLEKPSDFSLEPTRAITRPMNYYERTFGAFGLGIQDRRYTTKPVEKFFTTPYFTQVFREYFAPMPFAKDERMYDVLQIEFIDYVIRKVHK